MTSVYRNPTCREFTSVETKSLYDIYDHYSTYPIENIVHPDYTSTRIHKNIRMYNCKRCFFIHIFFVQNFFKQDEIHADLVLVCVYIFNKNICLVPLQGHSTEFG